MRRIHRTLRTMHTSYLLALFMLSLVASEDVIERCIPTSSEFLDRSSNTAWHYSNFASLSFLRFQCDVETYCADIGENFLTLLRQAKKIDFTPGDSMNLFRKFLGTKGYHMLCQNFYESANFRLEYVFQ